jgi:cardiolipin synthase
MLSMSTGTSGNLDPSGHADPARHAGPSGTADPSGRATDESARAATDRAASDKAKATASFGRIWTIPNLISFARLLGVPLFLYLLLVQHAEVAAVVVLAVGGTSDWVDGYLARRLHQVSRLGELLDPLADRLYILATLIALTVRDVLPWWFTVALLLRELVLLICLLLLRRLGYPPLPVHYLGKTATFILLFAFPVLLLAQASSGAHPVAWPAGWALAWWGLVLYWAAAVFYVVQVVGLVRAARREVGPPRAVGA